MSSGQFLVGGCSLPKHPGWNWTRVWLYSLCSPEHHWTLSAPVLGSFMLSEQPWLLLPEQLPTGGTHGICGQLSPSTPPPLLHPRSCSFDLLGSHISWTGSVLLMAGYSSQHTVLGPYVIWGRCSVMGRESTIEPVGSGFKCQL